MVPLLGPLEVRVHHLATVPYWATYRITTHITLHVNRHYIQTTCSLSPYTGDHVTHVHVAQALLGVSHVFVTHLSEALSQSSSQQPREVDRKDGDHIPF